MKTAYPTFIAKDKKDNLVYVPDFDIYTEGKSFSDAIEMRLVSKVYVWKMRG